MALFLVWASRLVPAVRSQQMRSAKRLTILRTFEEAGYLMLRSEDSFGSVSTVVQQTWLGIAVQVCLNL